MSMDPAMMQQMLAQKLQQPAQAGVAGGAGSPQMQGSISPANAAATLAQKAMLVRALQSQQQRQQQGVANAMMPGSNAMMQQDPQMQALQAGQQPLQMQTPPLAANMLDPNAAAAGTQ